MRSVDVLSASFADYAVNSCGKPQLLQALAAKELVWEDLIRAAEEEVVLPALHDRFKERGAISQIPVEISSFLSTVESLNGERNRAILSELATVASLLNAAGIEPILLKGAAYCATGVYANPGSRYLWDVDLLVPEPQMAIAVEVLTQNGFESQESNQLSHFRHHHPPLQRRGSVHFELHHSLGMGICRSLLPASEVLKQSVGLDFRSARVRVPSPEHMMTHLIMHSQIEHPYNERIWPPLRAMYDLVLLRQRFDSEIDWSAIERRFRKAGQFGVLALHLLQVQEVLGVKPPFPIRLTGLTYFRWLRRKILRALPPLRFLDPIYMYSVVLRRRLRLLKNALTAPGGWRHVVRELSALSFYKRFVTDIVEGHGR